MIKKTYCPVCGNIKKTRSKYCSYEHSLPAQRDAIEQLKKKEGPIYEKWKARLEASLERV